MKRTQKSILPLLLVIWLTACSGAGERSMEKAINEVNVEATADVRAKARAEVKQGDFVYRLYKEKEDYREGDSVKLIAELEYVGDRDSITISHEASPFYFLISESSGKYSFMFMMNQPLIHTKLVPGIPLVEEYTSGGAYLVEEGVAVSNKPSDLPFPAGHYKVKGSANFSVAEFGEEEEGSFVIEEEISFDVQP